jgi:hypothetical protein
VYATARNDSFYPPQLFDLTADIWEQHNIAVQNPTVVESLDYALRTEIDYPAVMVEYAKQGHDWAKRWTASYENSQWKALLHAAYRNFSAADETKFETWLSSSDGIQV